MIKIKGKEPTGNTIRPLINLGATLDIPTGAFIQGQKGDYVMNGGASNIVAITGAGNSFKSSIANYMSLKIIDVMRSANITSGITTYDSEDNMLFNIDRYNGLGDKMENIPDEPLSDPSIWNILSKSEVTAEDFIDGLYTFVKEQRNGKRITYEAFKNRYTGKMVEDVKPSVLVVDSLTEFEPTVAANVVEDGNINESNTVFMKSGLFKTKFLKDLPRISANANMYTILTAHLGKSIDMGGMFAPKQTKALQYLKQDQKIKGVTDKLYFLTTQLWGVTGTVSLLNRTTNQPEYPKSSEDNATDLTLVKLIALRSKTGPTGVAVELIVSQTEGVLPSLSEFHLIKNEKWGLEGSVRSYALSILPDVKLSRTTVRTKIDDNPRLRRALQITSEILQMKTYMKRHADMILTPDKLYTIITDAGYDWGKILDSRGYWTVDNYTHKIPYLSTLDLLRMAHKEITRKEFLKGKTK